MFTTILLGKVLPLLLKVIVGPLTYLLGRVLLNAWRSLDDLNPVAKRAVIFMLSLFVAAFCQVTGQQLPGECSGVATGQLTDACVGVLTSAGFLNTALTGIIGAAFAFLLHALKKSDPRS